MSSVFAAVDVVVPSSSGRDSSAGAVSSDGLIRAQLRTMAVIMMRANAIQVTNCFLFILFRFFTKFWFNFSPNAWTSFIRHLISYIPFVQPIIYVFANQKFKSSLKFISVHKILKTPALNVMPYTGSPYSQKESGSSKPLPISNSGILSNATQLVTLEMSLTSCPPERPRKKPTVSSSVYSS